MRVLLDREPCDVSASSIGEAIAKGVERAEAAGRLVVEVYVDGSRLDEAALTDAARLGEAAGEVAMLSAEPVEMVERALADAIAQLPEIDRAQRAAAEAIQADRSSAGMEALGAAIRQWLLVQEATRQSARLLGLNLAAVRDEGGTMMDAIGELDARLRDLRAALEAKDPVSIADTLLYEMPPVVERWRALLCAMGASIRAGGEREDDADGEGR